MIDAEIKRILTEAHDTARRDPHRPTATSSRSVTRRLLEIEVMEGDELRRILGLARAAEGGREDP